MKQLALLTLLAAATAAMATQPVRDPEIFINGESSQAVFLSGATVSNQATGSSQAHQNLASNSGTISVNGYSFQSVSAGPLAVIRNASDDDSAYALQDLASNVGTVMINGSSSQIVSLQSGAVSNEAGGRMARSVQNLASNSACFTCQKEPAHQR